MTSKQNEAAVETARIHAFVPKETKKKLQTMMVEEDTSMTQILIRLIDQEHKKFEKRQAKK